MLKTGKDVIEKIEAFTEEFGDKPILVKYYNYWAKEYQTFIINDITLVDFENKKTAMFCIKLCGPLMSISERII